MIIIIPGLPKSLVHSRVVVAAHLCSYLRFSKTQSSEKKKIVRKCQQLRYYLHWLVPSLLSHFHPKSPTNLIASLSLDPIHSHSRPKQELMVVLIQGKGWIFFFFFFRFLLFSFNSEFKKKIYKKKKKKKKNSTKRREALNWQKLKVRRLKWKTVKVKESVLHFCQTSIYFFQKKKKQFFFLF